MASNNICEENGIQNDTTGVGQLVVYRVNNNWKQKDNQNAVSVPQRESTSNKLEVWKKNIKFKSWMSLRFTIGGEQTEFGNLSKNK